MQKRHSPSAFSVSRLTVTSSEHFLLWRCGWRVTMMTTMTMTMTTAPSASSGRIRRQTRGRNNRRTSSSSVLLCLVAVFSLMDSRGGILFADAFASYLLSSSGCMTDLDTSEVMMNHAVVSAEESDDLNIHVYVVGSDDRDTILKTYPVDQFPVTLDLQVITKPNPNVFPSTSAYQYAIEVAGKAYFPRGACEGKKRAAGSLTETIRVVVEEPGATVWAAWASAYEMVRLTPVLEFTTTPTVVAVPEAVTDPDSVTEIKLGTFEEAEEVSIPANENGSPLVKAHVEPVDSMFELEAELEAPIEPVDTMFELELEVLPPPNEELLSEEVFEKEEGVKGSVLRSRKAERRNRKIKLEDRQQVKEKFAARASSTRSPKLEKAEQPGHHGLTEPTTDQNASRAAAIAAAGARYQAQEHVDAVSLLKTARRAATEGGDAAGGPLNVDDPTVVFSAGPYYFIGLAILILANAAAIQICLVTSQRNMKGRRDL